MKKRYQVITVIGVVSMILTTNTKISFEGATLSIDIKYIGLEKIQEFKRRVIYDANEVILSKCVDGDTARFIVNGKEETVRFLYIDTPESTTQIEPYGKEASTFTCNMLTNASKIELEYDGEERDKYDRLLAWVWVYDENGKKILLQEEVARNGYVEKYYDYGDYKYETRIKLAMRNKNGIFEG